MFIVALDTKENVNSGKNKTLTMQASAEIQRSDFGMQNMQMLVDDKVTFNLKIKAFRVPA
jgi:polyisoprenoid-binding protein YceI